MASKIILVTGANRGIGLGIVQSLAQRSSHNTIVLASRKKADADAAIEELSKHDFKSDFSSLALDVTSDYSIESAVAEIDHKFGRLDVLINNAGIALIEDDANPSTLRTIWTQVFDVNVFSVRVVSELFIPVLLKSAAPRIINISSVRGSFDRVTSGANPRVSHAAYSTSKAALNMLTLEMAKLRPEVAFYAVSPGHCRTAFNGFSGRKDPVDGGTATAELALAEKGMYASAAFWESEEKGMEVVGW